YFVPLYHGGNCPHRTVKERDGTSEQGFASSSIGSGRDRMATRRKQLTTASPMPPLKTAAKTEKGAGAPRLQRESQAIGERLSFQHWSKPFPWRGVRSAFVFGLPRFEGLCITRKQKTVTDLQ